MRYDDDDDDEEPWDEDDEDDGYIPCPHCGEPMYEEAGYCSSCERWISREDVAQRKLPAWMIMVIVALLGTFILGALRAF